MTKNGSPGRLTRVVYADDVRMCQVNRDVDLLREPVDAYHGREFRVEHFDGDCASVAVVRRTIHGRHPAAAELVLDRVAAGEDAPGLKTFDRARTASVIPHSPRG